MTRDEALDSRDFARVMLNVPVWMTNTLGTDDWFLDLYFEDAGFVKQREPALPRWVYTWGDGKPGERNIASILNWLAHENYEVVDVHRKDHIYEILATRVVDS